MGASNRNGAARTRRAQEQLIKPMRPASNTRQQSLETPALEAKTPLLKSRKRCRANLLLQAQDSFSLVKRKNEAPRRRNRKAMRNVRIRRARSAVNKGIIPHN
jgi:hypothetical protein